MQYVFWLEHYPRSISGLISYLSRKDEVVCLCYNKQIFSNREKMGWKTDILDRVSFVFLQEQENLCDFITKILSQSSHSIHCIMGVRYGRISAIVKKYLLSGEKKYWVFMIAERPYLYNKSFFEVVLLQSYYSFLGYRYRSKISGVFAMGSMGVKAYRNWANGNVFNFVYPRFNNKISNKKREVCFPIRALYVGQLDRRKGIDLLIESISNFESKINLDIVGCNGNMESAVIKMIDDIPNVNYLGVWASESVVYNTAQYDVCFVPSLYDGWGMFVMEALEAEVGVITTDTTGSKDLVFASRAGMVVKANSKEAMVDAVEKLVNNPNLISQWGEMAHEYRESISQETVCSYFQDSVLSVIHENVKKPQCPWYRMI